MTVQDRRDPECLFCQIVAGARRAEVVFETPATVAFLDRFPVARGHTLVVPRQHAATLLQLDDGAAGALFGSVVEVVEKLAESLHPAGFNVGWNHGAAAGQHVFHLHVHVLPRFSPGGSGVQAIGEGGAATVSLGEIAAIIRGGGTLAGRRRRPGERSPEPEGAPVTSACGPRRDGRIASSHRAVHIGRARFPGRSNP
ncbi:MAG TPA: HIT domain-containing protein [Anaeromyxobacteraceae bacterium]|nr:HIT domain-containing protein [Anaeromyxobacteraceae bacterium]